MKVSWISHVLNSLRPARTTRTPDVRRLVEKAVHVFMNNWMKQLAALCFGVFIARMYGAEGRGIYTLLTVGASLLGVVLSLGLNNSVIYHIKRGSISASRGLTIILANSLMVAGISALLLLVLKDEVWALLFESVRFSYFYLLFVACYTLVVLLTLFLVTYYLATHELVKHRVLIGTAPFATLAVTLASFSAIPSVKMALAAQLVVEGAYASFFALDVWRNSAAPPAIKLPLAAIYSFALRGYAGSLGSTILTQVDTMVVAAYTSPALLGYYAVSKSLYRVLLSIPQAFNGLLLGTFCDLEPVEAKRMNTKVMRLMALVLLLCTVPALLVGGPAVKLIYGAGFARSVPALNILLFAALFMGISSSSVPYMLASGNPGLISNISLVSGIISVSLTAVLVPYFSIEGAAVATLVGAICFLTLRMYSGRKIYTDASSAETTDSEYIRQEG